MKINLETGEVEELTRRQRAAAFFRKSLFSPPSPPLRVGMVEGAFLFCGLLLLSMLPDADTVPLQFWLFALWLPMLLLTLARQITKKPHTPSGGFPISTEVRHLVRTLKLRTQEGSENSAVGLAAMSYLWLMDKEEEGYRIVMTKNEGRTFESVSFTPKDRDESAKS